MNKDNVSKNEQLLSVSEAANYLGYSRQHVLRLINAGQIPAKRVGRSFVIKKTDLPGPFSQMRPQEKSEIDAAVKKVLKTYGEAIRKLGKE